MKKSIVICMLLAFPSIGHAMKFKNPEDGERKELGRLIMGFEKHKEEPEYQQHAKELTLAKNPNVQACALAYLINAQKHSRKIGTQTPDININRDLQKRLILNPNVEEKYRIRLWKDIPEKKTRNKLLSSMMNSGKEKTQHSKT